MGKCSSYSVYMRVDSLDPTAWLMSLSVDSVGSGNMLYRFVIGDEDIKLSERISSMKQELYSVVNYYKTRFET